MNRQVGLGIDGIDDPTGYEDGLARFQEGANLVLRSTDCYNALPDLLRFAWSGTNASCTHLVHVVLASHKVKLVRGRELATVVTLLLVVWLFWRHPNNYLQPT